MENDGGQGPRSRQGQREEGDKWGLEIEGSGKQKRGIVSENK